MRGRGGGGGKGGGGCLPGGGVCVGLRRVPEGRKGGVGGVCSRARAPVRLQRRGRAGPGLGRRSPRERALSRNRPRSAAGAGGHVPALLRARRAPRRLRPAAPAGPLLSARRGPWPLTPHLPDTGGQPCHGWPSHALRGILNHRARPGPRLFHPPPPPPDTLFLQTPLRPSSLPPSFPLCLSLSLSLSLSPSLSIFPRSLDLSFFSLSLCPFRPARALPGGSRGTRRQGRSRWTRTWRGPQAPPSGPGRSLGPCRQQPRPGSRTVRTRVSCPGGAPRPPGRGPGSCRRRVALLSPSPRQPHYLNCGGSRHPGHETVGGRRSTTGSASGSLLDNLKS